MLIKKGLDTIVFIFGYKAIMKSSLKYIISFCYCTFIIIVTNICGIIFFSSYLRYYNISYEIYCITIETLLSIFVLVQGIKLAQKLRGKQKINNEYYINMHSF